jgi:hypothetical protein
LLGAQYDQAHGVIQDNSAGMAADLRAHAMSFGEGTIGIR